MYSDRIEGESQSSIRDRLNGNAAANIVRRRNVTGKRQRQDDKWEHDLFDDDRPQFSTARKLGGGDLRLKLQRKSNQQNIRGGVGVRDLRDLLSVSRRSQQVKKDVPKPKRAPIAPKPTRRSVIVEASVPDTKDPKSTLEKKILQKADASVDGFLQSLGLEKYQIIFQAEEVDMTALEHMTDEDLKAMGIPMGPRKKIMLALNSRE